jgi:hypothetical protein
MLRKMRAGPKGRAVAGLAISVDGFMNVLLVAAGWLTGAGASAMAGG